MKQFFSISILCFNLIGTTKASTELNMLPNNKEIYTLESQINNLTNYHDNSDQKIVEAEELINYFLQAFAKEDYEVISTQYLLFTYFEKLIHDIFNIPFDLLKPHTAEYFARAFSKCANCYRRIAGYQHLALAVTYHKKALTILEAMGNNYSLEFAHALVDLGATYNELKGKENNLLAIHYYRAAFGIYEKQDAKMYIASTLHKLGNAHRDLDEANINLAIDYLDRALSLYITLPEDNLIILEQAKALYNQALNYEKLGGKYNLEKAFGYLNKAASTFKLLNNYARYAITRIYLANISRQLGNIIPAIESLNKALAMQKRLFNNREHIEIATTLYHLGLCYFNLADSQSLEHAIEYFTSALEIQKKLLANDQVILQTKHYLETAQKQLGECIRLNIAAL